MTKILPVDQAVRIVGDGATLGVGGAGGVQEPDLLLEALVARYRATGSPARLTEFHPIRCGEIEGRGTSLFGAKGMVARMIGGSFWPAGTPELIRRILDEEIAAWNLSIGVMYGLLEAAAAGRAGVLTTVGLNTFVDPRLSGGALNASALAAPPLVELVTVGGREQLFYHCLPIDVAFIRGTTADPDGNITMEEEPAICGALVLAQAARANGGKVIAQVKRVVGKGQLRPHAVRVPGVLVDAVVINSDQRQTTHVNYDPTLVGESRLDLACVPRRPETSDKIVLRRAILEAQPGQTLAIGFGLPGYLPAVAVEEGVQDRLTFVIEHGVIGGINGYACGGKTFPCSHNPEAIIDAADQLRYFAGGGLDIAYLGVGETDLAGNVNVSRFGDRIPGAGGFIDMTQGTRKVVFCSRLGGRHTTKIVRTVQQITFSGPRALREGQDIQFVTEEAVFRLLPGGLTLTELRPGLTAQDFVGRVGLPIPISDNLKPMPEVCFSAGPMGLSQRWSVPDP